LARWYHAGAASTSLSILALVISIGLFESAARAAQVTLRWDYDTSGAAGFVLYCGLTSRSYATRIDVGNTVTYTLNLADGATHFCSVTAYDPGKVESPYSNEVSVSVPYAAPKVMFAATPSSGRAPLDVGFTNTSAGQVSGWTWRFGDGSTSTLKNPTHRYLQPGTYYVSLTAVGPGGTATATASTPITVSTSGGANAGLVAAYGFNEGSGSSVADLSGNGNVGTLSGTTWINAGKFGKALYFNGSRSRITVKDSPSLDLSGGMTLSAWVYPTIAMTGRRVVILKERPSGAVYYLRGNNDRNRPATGMLTGTSVKWMESPSSVPANKWTHLAATYDGARHRLYVNGVQVNSQAVVGAIGTSGSPLRIGGDGVWGDYFRGRIDEVRIYNRALPSSEIQTIMNTRVSSQQ
jgi:PKD repeat protein